MNNFIAWWQPLSQLSSRWRPHLWRIGMVGCGLCLVGGGFLGLAGTISSKSVSSPQITDDVGTTDTDLEASSVSSTSPVLVSVQGAVQQPGLLTVPAETRVGQVIELAGGYSPQVDRVALADSLNLASKVTDGQQIWVPTRIDSESASVPPGSVLTSAETNLISLNTASQSELESLPGIGPVRAQAIMVGRPYTAVEELLSRQIVSSAAFEALASLVSVL